MKNMKWFKKKEDALEVDRDEWEVSREFRMSPFKERFQELMKYQELWN